MSKSSAVAAPGRRLPLTSFDRVTKTWPDLLDFISQDVEKLRSQGHAGAISSVDDIDGSAFLACVTHITDQMINHVAERSGLSPDTVRAEMGGSQELRSTLLSINQDYHNLLNFELGGRKTFYFSDNLTEHLLATELGIEADLVRLPFDSCLFVFTSDEAVDALYALFGLTPERDAYGKPVSVFLSSLPDHQHHPDCRRIIMTGDHWSNSRSRNVAFKREIAIRPGWSLNEALHTDWESLGEVDKSPPFFGTAAMDDATFYTDGLALFRLCLNAVLYLGSSSPEIVQCLSGRSAALQRAELVKSSTKAKKIRNEIKRESGLNYALVGETVPPIRVTKDAAGRSGEAAGGMSFREFATRFLVRGHWRNQACGQNMGERRLVWIKPYHKGPEMAELVNRPYVVA